MRTCFNVGLVAISSVAIAACHSLDEERQTRRTAEPDHGTRLVVAGPGASSSATDVPNTGIAVGPTHVVQISNGTIEVFNRDLTRANASDGGVAAAPLIEFVSPPGKTLGESLNIGDITDPRIIFDQQSGRFFYSANANAHSARDDGTFYYGYSNDNITDLRSGWCHGAYLPFPSETSGTSTNFSIDYNSLGSSSFGIFSAFNVYARGTPVFVTAALLAIPRPPPGPCPLTYWPDPELTFGPDLSETANWKVAPWKTPANKLVFAPQVANSINDPNVVGSPTSSDGVPSYKSNEPRLYIAALELEEAMMGGNAIQFVMVDLWGRGFPWISLPMFSYRRADVPAYTPAYLPVLEPDGGELQPYNLRLTNAVAALDPTATPRGYVMGVWIQHTVGGVNRRPAVRWYELGFDETPVVWWNVTSTPVLQWGEISSTSTSDDTSYFNGAISPALDGTNVLLHYNRSSSLEAPTIEMRLRTASTPKNEWGAATFLRVGTTIRCDAPGCRWGDQSGVAYDPTQTTLAWGSNQFVNNVMERWSTWNFRASFQQTLNGISGDGQTAIAGSVLPESFVVELRDDGGRPVEGAWIEWTALTSGATIQLGNTARSQTDSRGYASIDGVALGPLAGPNEYLASAANAASMVFSATGTPGLPVKWGFAPFRSPPAGVPISPAVQVNLEDQFGNSTVGTIPVTITMIGGPAGAALLGTTTGMTAAGLATFADLAVSHVGSDYQLLASGPGMPTVLSPIFEVLGPDHLGAAVASDGVAGAILPEVTVRVLDRDGDATIAEVPVSVALAGSGGQAALSGALVQTSSRGIARFPDLVIDQPGRGYSLTFSSPGLGSASSTYFDVAQVNASAVARLEVLSGDHQTAKVGSSPSYPFRVKLTDSAGTAVANVSLEWSTAQGGSIQSPTTVSDSAGVVAISAVLGTTPGAQTFSASINGLSAVFTATGVPALPAKLVFQVSPADVVAGLPIAPAVTVVVTDQYSNPVGSAYDGFPQYGFGDYGVSLELMPPPVPAALEQVSHQSGGTWVPGTFSWPNAGIAAKSSSGGFQLKASSTYLGVSVQSEPFSVTVLPDPRGNFSDTSPMLAARKGHSATLLPDGRVLIAGGRDSTGRLASAEVYSPTSRSFLPTGSMLTARSGHTATLAGDGTVLIVGGEGPNDTQGICELYNPTTGMFSQTNGTKVSLPQRWGHSASRLPDGSIVVAGGISSISSLALDEVDIFDPSQGGFLGYASGLFYARSRHTATPTGSGVLVLVGGDETPANGESYPQNALPFLGHPPVRFGHTGHSLPDGRVLLLGGIRNPDYEIGTLYNPTDGTFRFTAGSMSAVLNNAADSHAAALLPNGRVLVLPRASSYAAAGIYDPLSDQFGYLPSTGPLVLGGMSVTTLADGSILLAGGQSAGLATLADAQVFVPAPAPLLATPSSLQFGSTVVGQSTLRTVNITNPGAPLTVNALALPGGSFALSGAPSLPRVLATNESFAVSVVYAPTQAIGSESRVLAVQTTEGTMTVSLAGSAVAPHLSLDMASLEFGNVPTNTTSTLILTLSNTGGADLTFGQTTGLMAPFSMVGGPAPGATLAPGASLSVSVSFSPAGAGNFATTVQFESDSDWGPETLTLNGDGYAAPRMEASSSTVAFGSTVLNTTVTQNVTFTNTGAASLTITGVTKPTTPFGATGTPAVNSTLPPGGSFTATLSYKPTATGSHSGRLVVSSTGGNITVTLSGVGVAAPKLASSPASLAFGTIAVNTTSTKTLVISNSGGAPLTITSCTAPAAPFGASGLPASGAVMAAGASITVTVNFSPTTKTTFSGTLACTSSGGNVSVALSGTAVAPAQLVASPASLAFGHVALNGTSSKTVTLTNSGGLPLTFASTTPPATPFSASSTPTNGSTLAAGATKTVTVTFHPTVAGSYSGQLVVNSNAGSVSVAATGQSP